MNESIPSVQNQITEEMKPSATKLVNELRKYLRELEATGYSDVVQLLFDVVQEIENELKR